MRRAQTWALCEFIDLRPAIEEKDLSGGKRVEVQLGGPRGGDKGTGFWTEGHQDCPIFVFGTVWRREQG